MSQSSTPGRTDLACKNGSRELKVLNFKDQILNCCTYLMTPPSFQTRSTSRLFIRSCRNRSWSIKGSIIKYSASIISWGKIVPIVSSFSTNWSSSVLFKWYIIKLPSRSVGIREYIWRCWDRGREIDFRLCPFVGEFDPWSYGPKLSCWIAATNSEIKNLTIHRFVLVYWLISKRISPKIV